MSTENQDLELEGGFDMGGVAAPDNKEKEYLKPGFHKLTIDKFTYEQEKAGKTPLIVMVAHKANPDGDPIEFSENFYMSGKINKANQMSSVVRLQELAKGLTGDIMSIKTDRYTYTKEDQSNGTSETYTIPNPAQLTEILNKKLAGKTAIFKIGGEEAEDGKVYTKLTYSAFCYYTDKKNQLCRYNEERDFTESEYKFAVKKREQAPAPTHSGGIANVAKMEEL